MRKARTILFLLVLPALIGHSCIAQNVMIDKLLQELETAPEDTQRVKLLIDLSDELLGMSSYDQAIHYATDGLASAQKLRFRKGEADCLHIIGLIHYFQSDYAKAIDQYTRSMKIREEIGDRKGIAASLNNIGNIFQDQGDHVQAIDHFTRSLRIEEDIGNMKGIAGSLGSIGVIYQDLGDHVRAIDHHSRALKILEDIGDKESSAYSLANLGMIYHDQGDHVKAIDYFTQSLKIFHDIGDRHIFASMLNNLSIIHRDRGDFVQALDHCIQSLKIHEELGDKAGISFSLLNIGTIYKEQGDYAKALDYGTRALRLAKEVENAQSTMGVTNLLYYCYKALNQPAKALEMHELYILMRDSVMSEVNQKEVMRQQFQYDFDKKEALLAAEQEKKDAIATEQLRRKNQQRNAFIGGFALMLGLAGVSYRSYRIKKNDNAIITKEKARSEELLLNILPHEVAEELKAKGTADAKLMERVTVLFTDFKGFTKMSERLSPQELVADLNECFSAFDRVCEKYGIEKIKTIGDAYMAAGGLPTPNTTHAVDVVKAALEMAEVVEKGKMKKVEMGLPYFEIRVGVHTGPVVAGIVGIKKFQYDIWGDTVNTASRMESSGEVGKVNISESTYALVKDQFACEYRGEVEAKGKGKMGMYFVRNY